MRILWQRHYKLILLVNMLFLMLSGVGDLFCSTVKVVKHDDGQWQLLVDDQPYIIKGVCYNFWVIGDDPDAGTLRDWEIIDLDGNGKIDIAYDSWVDSNKNNVQDPDEKRIGDWQLLKEMGCNTIRVYQLPTEDKRVVGLANQLTFGHSPNKKLLRDLYESYGIRVIVGHFFGEWTIGSGAEWNAGTDYSDPKQRKRLLECIRVMVEEHKDEPYTLLWMIGNENFNPYDHDNAEKNVQSFLSLVNEAAELIHSLDPAHPVALCNLGQRNIQEIAKYAPALDIIGLNTYTSHFGLENIYKSIKEKCDKPVILTEYGASAWKQVREDEEAQATYHRDLWKVISANSYRQGGYGNSLGGTAFIWCDQWSLNGTPLVHDLKAKNSQLWEWHGLTSQGDGTKSPFLRQLRKAYFEYKRLWNEK